MITRFLKGKDWALICVAIIFILGQIWMDIKIPEYMGAITDSFLLSDIDVVVQCGWEMILCAIISFVLSLGAGFVLANASASIGSNLREAQFDRVQGFSEENINRFTAASLITRSTNDVTQVQNFIARGLQAVIKCPIIAVWAISKIYGTSWEWTAVTVLGVVILVIVMFVTLHFAKKRFMRIQWLTDEVNRATRESIDGIRVVRAYNAEDYQEARFSEANDNLLNNNISATKIMAPSFPIAQSMLNFVTMGIYWVGAGLILALDDVDSKLLLFSDMIVFTSYAAMVLSSFMLAFGIMRMLPRTMVGMKRIEEVVNTEPTIVNGDVKEPVQLGAVEFNNVSFRYPGAEHDAIHGVSFRIDPGKTLAIIGSTGSGKTTLINLIVRFYDATEGSVRVNGVDVKDYNLQSLRKTLGYVSQNAIIFSGSVDMNVNYGLGSDGRSSEDIEDALDISQSKEFVEKLPDGRESSISQRGKNLSGGQKQRISIARALCRKPDILLLDDTFSALDYKTDLELRSALKSEMSSATKVLVAQRIGTVMDADEIIVLDDGEVVGKGKHDELMRNCPQYIEIAESQMMGGVVNGR
ncbi:MAG: ABC transporter ATP-binding protein [Candidatus Methanomethylophilaceae archaeon]|nr:ABC transporter ATP-binding protein [Candidatus Methanomethylophilaceae archaeon]